MSQIDGLGAFFGVNVHCVSAFTERVWTKLIVVAVMDNPDHNWRVVVEAIVRIVIIIASEVPNLESGVTALIGGRLEVIGCKPKPPKIPSARVCSSE